MHAVTVETRISADHRLNIELPATFPVGEVEVTIRAKTEALPTQETLVEFLDWLKTLPPTGRSKEEILAQIAEERNSWGDN